MVALTLTPIRRDAGELYRHANPLIESWTGVPLKGVALTKVQVDDPVKYAVDVENLDTTASPARRSFRATAGAHVLTVNASGITLSSVTITGTSTFGAITCTTLNASGAVTLQSSLAVTGSSILAVTSATTMFVSLTLGVVGTSTLGVLNAGATSVTTLNASGISTLAAVNAAAGSFTTLAASSTLGVTGISTLGVVNAGATSVTTLGASGLSALAAVTCTTLTASSTVQGTQLISTVSTGTAPLTVASTTKVTNLNADLLDDQSGAFYLARSNHTGTNNADTLDGIDSTAFAQLGAAANFTTLSASSLTMGSGDIISMGDLTMSGDIDHNGTNIGVYGVTPVARQTVTGSRGGNAALLDFLTKMENIGFIINSTS